MPSPLALLKLPLINDITTSPADPLEFRVLARDHVHQGRDLSYPARFAPLQAKAYPHIAPLILEKPADEVFARVERLGHVQTGWKVVAIDRQQRLLEAVAMTPLMRFKDDVVVEVREAGRSRSIVHMRSRSRIGRGDFGANAKRIESFLNAVKGGISS